MARKKEYFCVPYDGWGQHGTEIYAVTAEEYKRERDNPRRRGAYFDSYAAAVYYTMD